MILDVMGGVSKNNALSMMFSNDRLGSTRREHYKGSLHNGEEKWKSEG